MRKVLFALFVCCGMASAQNSITFSFTIPSGPDLRTSAAVLDATGTMIRTLWGNVSFPPGTYTRTWDGKADQGAAATAGNTYTIKLLINNVTYTYDWWIGTTDSQWNTTANIHTRFQASNYSKIAWVGNLGWITPAYSERIYNVGLINKANPNAPFPASVNYNNYQIQTSDVASDGTTVYLMNRAYSTGYNTWVTALDGRSGQPVQFTNGTQLTGQFCVRWNFCQNPINNTWYNTTISVIDQQAYSATVVPTGIAVQRGGNVLAVAHGGQNQVSLFDKVTGSSLGTVTGITAPAQMAFTSEGLWVVAGGVLYEVTGVGSTNTVTAISSLGGKTFSNVVAVGANSATNSLFVLDGGTNQQVFEFAVTTHALTRTYGDLGGYNDCNPTISYTRLNVDNTATTGATTTNGSFVSSDDQDDVWIGDGGNSRILHISPSNQYVNQISAPHYNYRAIVSDTMPTRVFSHVLEYAVNYTVPNNPGDPDPIVGGNGSWKMVRNWGICAQGAHGSPPATFTGANLGIYNVEQLSNGRVYGQVHNGTVVKLYEFPTSGTAPLRDTGWTYSGSVPMMLRDGTMVYTVRTGSAPNYTMTVWQANLTGFNGSNNPQYGAFASVGAITTNSLNSSINPSSGWSLPFSGAERTTGGYYPVFWTAQQNNSATTYYPHLAGITTGFSSYAWTTLNEVCMTVPDFLGHFPCGAGYGGHNGIGPVRVEGRSIFASYDGQQATWGDQYYHFWEDGLLVGQFGNTQGYNNSPDFAFFKTARPENASNFGDISTTQVNGDVYLYHPDEGMAPMHRWHIGNLSSVHEWAGAGILQQNGTAGLTQQF